MKANFLNLKTLTLGVLVVSTLSLSCDKQDDGKTMNTFVSNDIEVKRVNVSNFNNTSGQTGDFFVHLYDSKELIFYTETESTKHLYYVQFIDEIPPKLNGKVSDLLFLEHGMIVNNNFLFVVNNMHKNLVNQEAKNIIKDINKSNSMEVIGVNHTFISKSSETSDLLSVEKINSAVDVAELFELIASSCDSGGEGSVSCSINVGGEDSNGCSVSCGLGYYACCDEGGIFRPSCTCIPEEDEG